jgi:hypothetical protein
LSQRFYPRVTITPEMLAAARNLEEPVRVHRTRASAIDSLAGILGEFTFAQWFYGDWRQNHVGDNKGQVDFGDIEVKTSAFPFRDSLNLLVRQDYASKRTPRVYVQIILDVPSRTASDVPPGTEAVISGWEWGEAVHKAPLRDFGAKGGGKGGYQCHYIAIAALRPVDTLKQGLQQVR